MNACVSLCTYEHVSHCWGLLGWRGVLALALLGLHGLVHLLFFARLHCGCACFCRYVCVPLPFHQSFPPCHVPCVHAELQFLRDGYSVCVYGSHAYLGVRLACMHVCLSFVCHVTAHVLVHACGANMFMHAYFPSLYAFCVCHLNAHARRSMHLA